MERRVRGITDCESSLATYDIIVVGASAGGVEALATFVSQLPRDLRAAVFVVLHLSRGRSVLPEILTRAGDLPAVHPDDGDKIEQGRIYVGRPDHHLTIEEGVIRVVHGPTENGYRPAIDPLFRSAARVYGPRVIGIILTGALDDGTAGLAAVKDAGGLAIVQDPAEAFASSMPRSALAFVPVDHVLPVREIGVLVAGLTDGKAAAPGLMDALRDPAAEQDPEPRSVAADGQDQPGKVSVFTCPECHGTLWEVDQRGIVRFQCRIGHVYSPESMLAAQTDSVDRALWIALRSLEDRAALTHRLSERARHRNHSWVSKAFEERALAADEHAAVVRDLLTNRMSAHDATDDVPAPPANDVSPERPGKP